MAEYNLYCDESCHLEHDTSNSMTIGAVIIPKEKRFEINKRINEIKKKYGIAASNEIKWATARERLESLYIDLVDYFFDDDDMSFRVILIPEKNQLDHPRFNQTHSDWYYKMYFEMLKNIFDTSNTYNVFVDIRDTHSGVRTKKLEEVCSNNMYDFSHHIIKKIQPIRSDEVSVMQITDILVGAVCRSARYTGLSSHNNSAKEKIIERIKQRSGLDLRRSTLPRQSKFNLFVWRAS